MSCGFDVIIVPKDHEQGVGFMISFAFRTVPDIRFAPGSIKTLAEHASRYGTNLLLIRGGESLEKKGVLSDICDSLREKGIEIRKAIISGEPAPYDIDQTVQTFGNQQIDLVVAIGGGSVLDAGKAISAMLPLKEPVKHYLEGVGDKTHPGTKIPFIAIPTTSGTGSEMTNNAVITEVGEKGFKKSLRHDRFVPDMAIIDPELMTGSPKLLTATCGMDTFTQLLESYLSNKATPLTDALAKSGLEHFGKGFHIACSTDPDNVEARGHMAYASMLSGMTLANANLGVVHGIASPMGAYYPIPHGVVCASLVYSANKMTMELLHSHNPDSVALNKYAYAARCLGLFNGDSDEEGGDALLEWMQTARQCYGIPKLSEFGIYESGAEKIAEKSGNKENPATLSIGQIKQVILESL